MRLFIAIPVSETIKECAAYLRKDLEGSRPDVKWVERENYHLTLKFLGEVEVANLEVIKEKLRLVSRSCEVFNLETNGVGFFPNRNRPRVIWIGIQGDMGKADFLAERIDTYLSEIGFEPEKKHNFHLTLGRVRSERGLDDLRIKAAAYNKSIGKQKFFVDRFLLMESRLSSRGPHYSIVESYFLEN